MCQRGRLSDLRDPECFRKLLNVGVTKFFGHFLDSIEEALLEESEIRTVPVNIITLSEKLLP